MPKCELSAHFPLKPSKWCFYRGLSDPTGSVRIKKTVISPRFGPETVVSAWLRGCVGASYISPQDDITRCSQLQSSTEFELCA